MKEFDALYFVGAGGIGMAALERYFLAKGKFVAGYDRTPSDLTTPWKARAFTLTMTRTPRSFPPSASTRSAPSWFTHPPCLTPTRA